SGWVLPDDVDTAGGDTHGVALLPALDPSVMGWKQRDWYLGDHAPQLFDRNGNAGPTVAVDGRVVGGWAQRPSGEVVTAVLEDVGAAAAEQIAAEAAVLTEWLDGAVVSPRFRSPLERELSR
ncbi:MAG: winged helix DNA-binding domain-containing protein, partial [Actinomycetota bacterium]|nr:winged helix DNA-binding domain-containing protein [Actinomycetota bacterium]